MSSNGDSNDSGITFNGHKDNLSTISTILGLALFCTLILTILVRRLIVQRHIRAIRTNRGILGPSNNFNSNYDPWLAARNRSPPGVYDSDDAEPRTIALGARAALLSKPIMWEEHLDVRRDEKFSSVNDWSRLQPCAFQLATPHTTAQFPRPQASRGLDATSTSSPTRRRRAYSHLPFHRTNHESTPVVPEPSSGPSSLPPDSQNSTLPNAANQPQPPSADTTGQEKETRLSNAKEPTETEPTTTPTPTLRPHPVQVSFLIAMPEPHRPSARPPNHPLPSISELPAPRQESSWIPTIEIGTTSPTCLLPSLPIKQDDLDSWWDLPMAPSHRSHLFANGISQSARAAAVERLFQQSRITVQELRPFPRNIRAR